MKNFFLILLFTPLLFACENGEEPQPQNDPDPEPTKQELAMRSWKVVIVKVGTTELDTANYIFQFNEDGSFSITAPDVDDPDFPDSGNWELTGSDQVIRLEDSKDLNVIMLTEEDFILEYSYQNFKDGEVTFRFELEPV